MSTTLGRFILWHGRTLPLVAILKSNGIDCVCVMENGRPRLIPAAVAVQAPMRSAPRLVWENPNV